MTMKRVTFRCELCKFRTKTFLGWRTHLLSADHQSHSRQRILTDAEKKRYFVVFGVGGLERKAILEFFCGKSIITDFIFWEKQLDICLVHIPLKSFRQKIVAETNSILEVEVVLRLRDDISDIEWRALCPEAYGRKIDAMTSADSPESEKDDCVCVAIERPPQRKREVVEVETSSSSSSSSSSENSEDDAPPSRKRRPASNAEVGTKHVNQPPFTHVRKIDLHKHILYEVKRLRDAKFKQPQDLQNYLSQLIRGFNLSAWENLFGIELYETSLDHPIEPRFVQVDSIVKGILISPDKINPLSQRQEVSGFYKARKGYLATAGTLMWNIENLNPLKRYHGPSSTTESTIGPPSFDLQIGLNVSPANGSPQILLHFRNIRWEKVQFFNVVRMYSSLLKEFLFWNLRQIQIP